MSQSLTNDLPDKFGSSDEDDDDEEVVGWMGAAGDFEARNHDNDEVDDDDEDEDVREFGRRGIFNDRWEGGYEEEADERKNKLTEEDLGQEVPLATSTTDLTASVDSLRLQDDHQTSLSGEAPAENRATHESDSPSEGSNHQLKLSK